MKKSASSINQKRLLLVHFPNGGTQPALAVDNGVPVPMFKDLKYKVPLVVGSVVIIQGLLILIGYAILNMQKAEVPLSEGNNELDSFWNTQRILTFGNSMCFSTIFLAFTGLTSMMLWELNVMKRAPQLSIEVGFHRMIRIAFLIFVIALGLFNTIQPCNLYTLLFEMFLIFVFFVMECSYHVMLLMYISVFNKYAYQQETQGIKFFKDTRDKNPDYEKVTADLKQIQIQTV